MNVTKVRGVAAEADGSGRNMTYNVVGARTDGTRVNTTYDCVRPEMASPRMHPTYDVLPGLNDVFGAEMASARVHPTYDVLPGADDAAGNVREPVSEANAANNVPSNREHEMTIVVNQWRGFVAALYKFFCEASPCDWDTVYKELNRIKAKIDGLLADISERHDQVFFPAHIYNTRGGFRENTDEFNDIVNNFSRSNQPRSRSTSRNCETTFPRQACRAPRPKSAMNRTFPLDNRSAGRNFQVHSRREEIEDMIGAPGNSRRWRNSSPDHGLLDLS